MSLAMNHRERDEGAVAVTTAILLVALVLMAAVVVDLGLRRIDHRGNQSVADMAVTAGGLELGADLDRIAACQQAWAYLVQNLQGGTAPEPTPNCATVFDGACDNATRDELVGTLLGGSVDVRIRMPVFDTDPPMQEQRQSVVDSDGEPCERISVEVTQDRRTILAGVAGFTSGGSLAQAAAVRREDGTEPEYATLIILEQNDCTALTATGGGGIVVENFTTSDGVFEGLIHLDSDGSAIPYGNCSGASQVVVTPGTAGGSVICSGVDEDTADTIFASDDCGDTRPDTMRVRGPNKITQDRFLEGGAQDHQLESDPLEVGARLTRKLADHRYNCKSAYPVATSTNPQWPADLKEDVPSCGSGLPPHMDTLVGATTSGLPGAPFHTLENCDPQGTVVRQYLYVPCDRMPMGSYEADVIVLRGRDRNQDGINVGNGQVLNVRPFSRAPGGPDGELGGVIFVVRDGNVTTTNGATLGLVDTFVYLHDGDVRVTGGTITWTAPDSVGYDDDGDAVNCADRTVGARTIPDPSCFQNLALWSNEDANHTFAGSGAANVRGVYFTPNAPFELSGSGGSGAALGLRRAQFFTRKLIASGGNGVVMKPDPNVFLETPRYGVGLIR